MINTKNLINGKRILVQPQLHKFHGQIKLFRKIHLDFRISVMGDFIDQGRTDKTMDSIFAADQGTRERKCIHLRRGKHGKINGCQSIYKSTDCLTVFVSLFALKTDIMKTEKFLTFFQGQSEISCKRLKSLVGKNTFVF